MSRQDVISQFRDSMRGAGLNTGDNIVADGKLHRFQVEGDHRSKRNGWYVLHLDERPAGVFGCNRRMGAESIKWTAKGLKKLNDSERRELLAKMKADAVKREAKKQMEFARAAVRANIIWEGAASCESHPYLTRKNVQANGLRVAEWVRDLPHDQETGEIRQVRIPDALLVPIKNASKEIVSLQAIFPETHAELGRDKDFLPGGEKRGCWYSFGKPGMVDGRRHLIIAEGYATAASLNAATGFGCVVTFDAGNMQPVGETVRRIMPDAVIIIAADNDQFTQGNPGVDFATRAAKACGGHLAVPKFKDLDGKPTDFNDLYAREGIEAVLAQITTAIVCEPAVQEAEPVQDPEPDQSPEQAAEETEEEKKARLKAERKAKKEAKIAAAAARATEYALNPDMYDPSKYFTMLGHDRKHIYVYSHEMELVVSHGIERWSRHTMLQIAPPDFWRLFSANPEAGDDPEWDFCENWLIRESYRKGFYDPSMTRGRGAWHDEGRIIYHFGNKLMMDGVETAVTAIKSEYIYEQGKRLPPPADEPLSDEEGRRLCEIAKMFRWTKPGSAVLLAGYVALAPICGALKWRPHIWITGAAGSGKTTVLDGYVSVLMAGTALFSQGNSTEAGIRQQLQSDALPVIFDESEQGDERAEARVQNVIGLARQASSESGAKTYKGSQNGVAVHYHIRSMFCLSSIAVHIKSDADRDRLTVLALKPRRENGETDSWPQIKEALHLLAKDEDMPAGLMRRGLDLLPITLKNIEVFADAAAKKFGSQREGDQYGTLMAGAWSLCTSALVTPEQAAKMIDRYDWSEYVEHTETDDSIKALQALLTAKIRLEHGKEASVFDLLFANLGWGSTVPSEAKEAEEVLRKNGIVTTHREAAYRGTHFAVLTSGPEIAKLLQGSQYQVDFHGQLSRLPGAIRTTQTISINGTTHRGFLIPLTAISQDEAAEEPPTSCETETDDAPF